MRMLVAATVMAGIALSPIAMTRAAEQERAEGRTERNRPVERAYGQDDKQKLDVWRAEGTARPAPLILFVHGGGWKRGDKRNATGSAKVDHFLSQGYAVASINYRLVPEHRVEDQAADVAAAFAWARRNAAQLNIDPARIILMGHSAGAHLVALVGTDPAYARAAGFSLSDIRGVVPLDGAAYDVAQQMDGRNRMMQSTYEQAFGTDPARQRALSPTLHAAAPNAPAFLILHVQRSDGTEQSRKLAKALKSGGTAVELHGIEGRGLIGHMQINRKLGEADYPATPIVDRWLKTRL
ncbi:alpha/beta hydrolase [Sphingomonas sp. BGYR3]|uniref:alpha/beta hydrolase n=1 Tax=Sphingomonas sp. BGYR3 TaxID=2975483 RepID=UPI0021A54E96|nr:alpha/beta hydrolase [Sphingomonas sp. BGYR3]MDG5489837.1 alpha/beta hydrolase [Sphingomonas sp. BGYR3]